jgi:RNA-directed DNA polymerase
MKATKILSLIAAKSQQNRKEKFTSLAHLLNEEMLVDCFSTLHPKKAVGSDGVTVQAYQENLAQNVSQLVTQMKSKKWRPQSVRRVYIPKPGKVEKRPLGIPSTEDKMIQEGVRRILESIFEPDFLDCSHGFRPNRSCHTALVSLNGALAKKPVNFVVEVDIRGFFDNVSHYWLQRCLEERISDPNFLWVIRRILKAGVMEEGRKSSSEQGTPQGGIVSPLLANIYLHYVLDLWFERKFKNASQNFMQLIRYCDDFVVAFESRKDAEQFLTELHVRLAKFGLEVAPEKTRLLEFGKRSWKRHQKAGTKGETFSFLGFTHYMTASRAGFCVPGHKTSKENLRRKLRDMKEWLRKIRATEPLPKWRSILNSKLVGHYNYFGVSGNMRCLRQYFHQTKQMLFKWLNRRSQKKSFNWAEFSDYLERNPLPQPRIRHRLFVLKPVS